MRLWYLIRDRDLAGGPVGRLAEVLELENGMAVVAWLPASTGRPATVDVHESMAAVLDEYTDEHSWLESGNAYSHAS